MLAEGCKVALLDIDEKQGQDTAKELKAKYGQDTCHFFKCDVTDDAEFEECFKKTMSIFGGLDIVVNNAGVGTTAGCKRIFAINTVAVLHGIELGLKYMGKDMGYNGGLIINVASGTGFHRPTFMPVYAASKSAVISMTLSFGSDLYFNRHGVKVSCFCPGPMDTPMLAGILSELKAKEDTACFTTRVQRIIINVDDAARGFVQLLKDNRNGAAMEYTLHEGSKYHEFQE